MAIRIYNSCANTHLLAEYNIDGIRVTIKNGKDCRHICACGNVTASADVVCTSCGNETWVNINTYNRWYVSTHNKIKSKDNYIFNKISPDEYAIIVKGIFININDTLQTFSLVEKDENILCVNSDKFNTFSLEIPAVPVKLDDVHEFMSNNLDKVEDDGLREDIIRAYQIANILDIRYNMSRVYSLIKTRSISSILTDVNLLAYKKFWRETVHNKGFEVGDPWVGKMFGTMEDLFDANNLPKEFKAYYASNDFHYPYTYQGVLDIGKFRALNKDLQLTIKHAVEHQSVRIEAVASIANWADANDESHQLLLAKFIKKNSMMFLNTNRIFDEFIRRLETATTNGWDLESIVSYKRFSILEAEKLLLHKKFPKSRVDGFLNCVDNDILLAANLLGSKGQLKKEEAEKIYK